jgi:hypothetical protein
MRYMHRESHNAMACEAIARRRSSSIRIERPHKPGADLEDMMKGLFPRALVACIGEARAPAPAELAALSEKLWHEALAPRGIAKGFDAARLALVALAGTTGAS